MAKNYETNLGEALSDREAECYEIISSTSRFKTTMKIYESIYGTEVKIPTRIAHRTIGVLVNRIRAKLGETAIITKPGLGYQSRRSLITEIVESNSKAK